jgi:hypothetical protein
LSFRALPAKRLKSSCHHPVSTQVVTSRIGDRLSGTQPVTFNPDPESLLGEFNAANAAYIGAGAHALATHGRSTRR